MVDIEVQPATSVRPIDHDRQFPRKVQVDQRAAGDGTRAFYCR
jgi:hypothetical protein